MHGPVRVAFSVRLDGLIVALGAAAVAAPFVWDSTGTSASVLESAVGSAYPVFGLLLLIVLVAQVIGNGWRLSPMATWLTVAVLALVGANIAYLLGGTSSEPVPPSIVDAVLALSMVLFATGVWSRDSIRDTKGREPRPLNAFLPVIGATIALVVPVMQMFGPVPAIAIALAVATIGVVLIRLVLSLHDTIRLLGVSRQARTDELTTLPNRRGFFELLDQALQTQGRLAVLLFDLDGFKEINDTLGHAAGDELLQSLSARLNETNPGRRSVRPAWRRRVRCDPDHHVGSRSGCDGNRDDRLVPRAGHDRRSPRSRRARRAVSRCRQLMGTPEATCCVRPT